MKLLLLVLLLLFVMCGVSCSPDTNATNCPEEVCKCTYNEQGQASLSCNISKSHDYASLKFPNTTQALDLSYNKLSHVPSELFIGLSQLTSLSLSGNIITVIHGSAFQHLPGLRFLNLSYNKLKEWNGPISTALPSIVTIDLTGNPTWPPDKLFNVSSLAKLIGATWSSVCVNCNLTRRNTTSRGPPPGSLVSCNQAAQYVMQGFNLTCNKYSNCIAKCPIKRQHKKRPQEVSNTRKLYFYVGYGIGSLAIIVNGVVLINVLLSKVLRRDLSMMLICNMAVCDIMIGCYTIVISNSNIYEITSNVDWMSATTIQMKFPFCSTASVLITIGQIVSVVTSLLLTLEKYMCIVYCMNPDVRLRMKHVVVVIVTIWIISLVFALSPIYGFIQLKYSPDIMCTMPVNREGSKPTFVIYPLAIIALNYLLMIPMYVHIFIVVSHSSTEMRVYRNAALAKKVAIMICTNFVFLAVPMSLLIVYAFVYQGHEQTNLDQPILHFIVYVWLPVQLLAINSLLNPFLYAFRYRKFQKEFSARSRLGGRLTAQLRRSLSAIIHSKMSNSPSTSRIELYQVGRGRSVNIHDSSKKRSSASSQIPTTESAVTLRAVLSTRQANEDAVADGTAIA